MPYPSGILTSRILGSLPLLAGLLACTAPSGSQSGSGGVSGDGSDTGSSSAVGGGGANGGNANSASGGTSNDGGSPAGNGGSSADGGSVNSAGGATASGGTMASGGGTNTGGEGMVGPGSYALPPPSQCHNEDYIDGCIEGDESSKCGGKCSTINACLESSAEKPYADVTFICPRFMLFADEMKQAAIDDDNSAFNYAVVGHDVDSGGIDGAAESTCCQCYQLIFAHPSPNNDRQALEDPDNPDPPSSGIPVPPPLIVQSFNTAATPTSFDIYMAAGGFGANNACGPGQQPESRSGMYMYSEYPTDGQPSQGGVKPASLYDECKTDINWVTTESISSDACQSRVEETCGQLESDISGLTEQATHSCTQSNNPDTFYHLNWSVYAKKVECPEHLTEVTGCKLAPQGLPEADPDVTTAAQAAADASFWDTSSNGDMYETTTMEDCCRPSCASTDWIEGKGLEADSEYNAFYSCDPDGIPITEPESAE